MEQRKIKRLDKKNIKLLQMLDTNARTSIVAIAKQLRLTENAIRYRIERLKMTGFLNGYSLKLSASHFGKNIQVVFSVVSSFD